MVSAMDWNSFRTLAKDVVNEYTPHIDWQQVAASPYYMGSESLKTFLPIADSIRDSAPLDAYILYLCFYNFRAIYAAARNPVGYAEKYDFEQQWTRFKRHYTQHIYEKSSHLFKEVEYTAGKRYAPNHWGIKVTVDGQQVKQY
jgi:hypothetical protein